MNDVMTVLLMLLTTEKRSVQVGSSAYEHGLL